MSRSLFVKIRNGEALDASDVADAPFGEFKNAVLDAVASGGRIALLCAAPEAVLAAKQPAAADGLRLLCVIAWDEEGQLGIASAPVGDAYPSLTPECPQAHLFEREIYEQWNLVPLLHPWLKPLRFHAPYGKDAAGNAPSIGHAPFFQLQGVEVHEVAVGPVHAGVIEPGHFRFQCHGENVYHLEISLGYQHRGIERARTAPGAKKRRMYYAETMAGDTTIAHATAYAQAVEAMSALSAPPRALALRGIALELERLANHTGDLGALAGDVGFLPTAAYCGRLRGDFLNMTALLCGNRFGRGMIAPGGVGYDVDGRRVEQLRERLDAAYRDVADAVALLFDSPSVMARFENIGRVSKQTCVDLGMVGPSARACGIRKDARSDFPAGIFNFVHIPAVVWESGDVFARAFVRWLEMQQSIEFIQSQLSAMPEGEIISCAETAPLGNRLVVSLVEGWRGEVCHCAIVNSDGEPAYYKAVDPSFHNWMGLAMAMRGQQISDFPLCNKSFNLSYCGHDL